ncbi:hypothetical protein ACA910_012319 [Epithemia clementina (nom. ined.)]
MLFSDKQTSLITILSSEHGRMRREQRDISMRDLQKALKYGTRKTGWGARWMVEYDGVIFITDSSMRLEITSYPSPLAMAPIDIEQLTTHAKTKQVLEHKPEFSTTHTVLVVDNSGSMTTKDIDLYRCRQTAAYTMTALEFIAEQIFNGTANNRDLFSLVEFSSAAKIVFSREPLGWVLYNTILERRDSRNYQDRQTAQIQDIYHCDSNYMPALDKAEELLDMGNHETCALNLYFLSDGAPTDAKDRGLTPNAMKNRLAKRMEEIAERFGKQLNVQLVGFGSKLSDFSTMRCMADAVNVAPGDAKADFLFCDKMANKLRTAASSLIASSTVTRTTLMEDAAAAKSGRMRTMRDLVSEKDLGLSAIGWDYYRIQDHFVFNPKHEVFQTYPGLPYGSLRSNNEEEAKLRQRRPPMYLAINKAHCGMGAERVAFRCHLADAINSTNFLLGAMVAKETKLVERVEENMDFHRAFCETQDLAQHLAEEFNYRVKALPDYNKHTTPVISFLRCSVLVLEDREWKDGRRGVLVEKMLDTVKFQWRKWNDNDGGVNGAVAPIDVDMEMAKINQDLGQLSLGAIAEGDSDDEEDEDSDGTDIEDDIWPSQVPIDTDSSSQEEPSEYLQAFTHFTYLYTSKKVMVCDLQGVYNTDMLPPTFELSDPAIHYSSQKGREMVFGRTDKGKEGMQRFFNTHKCSSVCKFLKLSKKNKNWRKDWHRFHGKSRSQWRS